MENTYLSNEIDNKNKKEKLKKACEELMKLLASEYNPHVTVIVTPTSIELFQSEISIQEIHEFLVD